MSGIKQYPVGEAVNMLFEDLVPSFAWFFPEKPEAVKFRKAVTTELGRRATTNPEKTFTTSLITTVHADKVVFFVVIVPKTEGDVEDESNI